MRPDDTELQALIEAAKKIPPDEDSRKAYCQFVDLTLPILQAFLASRLLRNQWSFVDDLSQDTYLRFYEKIHSYDPSKGAVTYYLFGIAKNQVKDFVTRRTRIDSLEAERLLEKHDPPDSQAIVVLANAIKKLSEEDQRLIRWRWFDKMRVKDIAERLSSSGQRIEPNAITYRLKSVLTKLQNLIAGGEHGQ